MLAAGPIVFYVIAAAMAAVALTFVLPRLLLRRGADADGSRDASNVTIHRSALADLEREHASGGLDDSQFDDARDELARRLLAEQADDQPPRRSSRTVASAVAIALALPLAAFGLYAIVGDPRAVSEVRASDDSPASIEVELERHLARHPRDARGHVMLARVRMQADRFAEAAASYEAALGLSPKVAADAGVWCEYADALGMAQGGTLTGKPSELIAKALALDASHPKALEMAGSAAYERREFAAAARHWRTLLQSMRIDAAGRDELAAAVARAERLASTSLPPAEPSSRGG